VSAYARRSRSSRRAVGTSWDHLAGWYDGWVGARGSVYHRQIAIPVVLELLDPQAGEEILDLGAGQGVVAPYVAATGARYTGVDASERLIQLARARHGRDGRFLVADVARADGLAGVGRRRFDAAVFLLSIQDMDPLPAIFASMSSVLRPTSRVVVLMTHPSFRQPRHSGWGFDESRKLSYRRIDSYLTPMAVPMKSVDGGRATTSFHRPVSAYVNGLARHGFMVDAMREPGDLPSDERPGRRRSAEGRNPDIPLFLALRARRERGV